MGHSRKNWNGHRGEGRGFFLDCESMEFDDRRNRTGIPVHRGGERGRNSNVGDRCRENWEGRGVLEELPVNEDWAALRWRQVECPIFGGDDPDGWLFRMEQFFSINRCSDKEKLITSGIWLEGDALLWFQWQNGRRPFHNWSEFRVALLQ